MATGTAAQFQAPAPPKAKIGKKASAGAEAKAPAGKAGGEKKRLVSLDAFRGLTIILMLLVNNAAMDEATPQHLTHADWKGGLNLADVVFPWFLFIVGVAIPFARKPPVIGHLKKAAIRAGMLITFGCLVDSAVAHQPLFNLGVLQLIGLAYLVGAVLGWLPATARVVAAGALLWLHAQILWHFPVPGAAPGTISEASNAINYLNQEYLGKNHLAGLLSVIPTAALVTMGSVTGDFLRWDKKGASIWFTVVKSAALIAVGAVVAYAGFRWGMSGSMPINKPLWTGSYILACGGLGMCILGGLYFVTDGPAQKVGRAVAFPLVVPGTNAIFAYVVPILVKIWILQTVRLPLHWPLTSGNGPTIQEAMQNYLYTHLGRANGGWTYTLSYIAFWWCILWVLNRKKWYLRV